MLGVSFFLWFLVHEGFQSSYNHVVYVLFRVPVVNEKLGDS